MTAEPKEYASESGHWYTRTGEPAYFSPYADKKRAGELKPTTIREAKLYDLVPSVSGILKVMGKGDALSGWMKEQVARAAVNVFWGEEESEDDWVSHVLSAAETNMNSQRDKGTKDHGIVEQYFREVLECLGPDEEEIIKSRYADCRAVEAVTTALGDMGVLGHRKQSEKSFSSPLGYGGKIDLCGADHIWVADFKFVTRLNKKLDYMDRCAQGAAYLVGKYGAETLSHGPYGRFANIFVSTEDYTYSVREWSPLELKKGWEIFSCCLNLWRALNNYYP